MDAHPDKTGEVPNNFLEQLHERLLGLKKARIAGAKLASIVQGLLPEGKSFRDFLPADVDKETASFRVFAERSLSAVVTITSNRRGTDVLYDIINSGQDVEPEPGDLWRAFVSVKPQLQLILDTKGSLLSAVEPSVAVSVDHVQVMPVSLGEHKSVCEAYLRVLKKRGATPSQFEEVLQDYTVASYAKWLKVLRTHTPPLDREWGEFRRREMLVLFGKRLEALDLRKTQATQIAEQFANDAPKTAAPSLHIDLPAAPLAAVPPSETVEDQVRRRLHSVIDRMTLEQMNALLIPFSLFPTDATN